MVRLKNAAVINALRQAVPKWGVAPNIFRGGDKDQASTLLGLKALDSLITHTRIPEGMFQVMINGRAEPPRSYSTPVLLEDQVIFRALDPSSVYGALGRGASLLLAGVNEFWPPLRDLCAAISQETGLECSAFAFVSPARGKGFVPHIDRTDQLVIQCEGSKDWTVYDVLPGGARRGKRVAEQDLGHPTFEGTLSVGDMLYIPVGAPHVAFASKQFSAHITLIFEPVTLSTSLRAAFESIMSDDSRLTSPLPPFYRDEANDWTQLIVGAAADVAAQLPDQSERCLALTLGGRSGSDGTQEMARRMLRPRPNRVAT